LFCESLKERGYAVLSIEEDVEFLERIERYYAAGEEFFALSRETKDKYVHPEHLGRDNRGFVWGELREFIKHRPEDPPESWPAEARDYEEAYRNLFPLMYDTCWRGFLALSEYPVLCKTHTTPKRRGATKDQGEEEQTDDRVTRKLMIEEDVKVMAEFANTMSSMSLNHYFNKNEVMGTKHDAEVVHTPSSPHCDTGLLTMLVCSEVPGLQFADRKERAWVDIEVVFEPKKHLIVWAGEKIPLFSASSLFPSTCHRVEMLSNVERTSLLFLLDVSK